MQTNQLDAHAQEIAPDGADVRLLISSKHASAVHCTLPPGTISHAVYNQTVSEFWHVLSGTGKIWRKQNEEALIVDVKAGTTIDIPAGTHFQYLSNHDEPLVFICFTMPPWPGDNESVFVEGGPWEATCQPFVSSVIGGN